jgi:hypothetical protein
MVKKKHKIHVKQSKTYPRADICSDHNVVVLKYKLQRKKRICKPAINNLRWAVGKLKEEKEKENYNNRIKQNLNYRDRDNRYKLTIGELKACNNSTCKRDNREIKATI